MKILHHLALIDMWIGSTLPRTQAWKTNGSKGGEEASTDKDA
ncbi:hypothetical protein HanXRQr2_Chr13g0571371 [Helianthus annuus]|uniref:Uncharacterized protein n=1 Tax=Helianthus annuus TaxID=4232 RepID=A0A9K3EGN0_HELAN|nr:hypothetical protein HanXRQr2_Chr13g0571371 [Helianthus annuus]